jgi:hypothetical protein
VRAMYMYELVVLNLVQLHVVEYSTHSYSNIQL